MAHRDSRPPRANAPPGSRPSSMQPSPQSQTPPQHQFGVHSPRPMAAQGPTAISFQATERGDRSGQVPDGRAPPRSTSLGVVDDIEDGRVLRKKSLVRPDRERIDENHRQWHYRSHAAQLDADARVGLKPSSTGNYPMQNQSGLRRGKSLLGREQDNPESGLTIFKRAATLRRKRASQGGPTPLPPPAENTKKRSWFDSIAPGPVDAWMIYCFLLTCCIPAPLLAACGIRTPEQVRAWREKMGLLAIIGILMGAVGFLTFGFQEVVCGSSPPIRFETGSVREDSVIIHGVAYNLSTFNHPAAGTTFNGQTNPLRDGGLDVKGKDISFMFQNVNQNCKDLITASNSTSIPNSNNNLAWYFPCNAYSQTGAGTANFTGYDSGRLCHTSPQARTGIANEIQNNWQSGAGAVYYRWDQVGDLSKNLAVYESAVLDLNLLQWLNQGQVNYPPLFDELKKGNGTYNGKDLTMTFYREGRRNIGSCLRDTVTVGYIDTDTIGCVASQVVLILSLVFIIGVVAIKFAMAVIFGWFLSWQLGTFRGESYEQRMQRAREIEQWTDDIYRPAPGRYRPNVNAKSGKKGILPNTSRFTRGEALKGSGARPATTYDAFKTSRPGTTYDGFKGARPATTYSDLNSRKSAAPSVYGSKLGTPGARSNASLPNSQSDPSISPCPFPLGNVVPQPGPEFQPFNFPLAHTICLVTAYSESVEGLRTTLDSLATTDYPNSHKIIMVIADGMVKGQGNDMTTPEIVLSMMKEFVIPPEEVEAHSYVAIADGHKRHNMAKVYAGYYDYDNNTMEQSKQQRVPIVLVSKVGNPHEQNDAKPGNRGKRDSQIVLMAFLQKVMFDERMTTFEYEFFNSLWRVTGVSPDRYEIVLCVDADTKVFPDSLTRMVSCMVDDGEIMGLCGETKIANKGETWVTMIQVFEYYISHHLTKAFESMFGGVTCLPGCFCMYRIKAPKGDTGYWVPILANPDIVEHYSENIVDTLHKKNLLLLGEDRFLTTLMLKTFPKRKMMFVPQAVCKTIVPDSFGVLLSQRRRWINSTIHNLAELLLVRDLCGTFCFSMQFVVFMELAGTLVLPAAISFTFYLIIVAIKDPVKPVIPLVLLGIILGLPGLLIVVTSRKVAYLGWMLIYLASLPIWNFALPAYAFWHFDDFSWGQTRKVTGEKATGGHGDKEGEFDSSRIVMKRWAEFERDRRWRAGTHSRDSTFNDYRSGSPGNKRYSLVSAVDTYPESFSRQSQQPFSGSDSPDHRGSPLVMLPAPLAVNRPGSSPAPSFDQPYLSPQESNTSHQRLVMPEDFTPYSQEPLQSPDSQYRGQSPRNSPRRISAVLRTAHSGSPYPGETQNPYRHSQHHEVGYEFQPQQAEYETEEDGSPMPHGYSTISSASMSSPSRGGGISLVDSGPVAGPDGTVRRVARKRQSSQTPPSTINPKRFSNASLSGSTSPVPTVPSLPPGAAAPKPYPRYD